MIGQTDWLPSEAWQEFKKMRRAKKAPMTEYAEKLMLKRLQEMVTQQGQSAQAVLDQSIIHNWTNIYCVKLDEPVRAFSPAQLSVVPTTRVGQAWNLSNEGIIAKAKQCGLTLRAGESYEQIARRVSEYLNDQDKQRQR